MHQLSDRYIHAVLLIINLETAVRIKTSLLNIDVNFYRSVLEPICVMMGSSMWVFFTVLLLFF